MDRRILISYYSRSGVTRRVAENVAAELKCDIEGIEDVRSRKGLFGWLRSGRESMRRTLPPIMPTVKDPAQYDLVVLGTPVWAGVMASPLRTYITANKSRLKQVAFLVTMGAAGNSNIIPDMKDLCGKEPVATLVLQTVAVKSAGLAGSVREFAARLRG